LHSDAKGAVEVKIRSLLQPLYASINEPVNDYFRKEYEDWVIYEKFPHTPCSELKWESANKFAERLTDPLKNIARKALEQSFRTCIIKGCLMTYIAYMILLGQFIS
jgi:hypothetical protein